MSNVLVAVRVRPLNSREEKQGSKVAVKIDLNTVQVTNFKVYPEHDSRTRTRHFAFDFCYWAADKSASNYASQQMIYEDLGIKVLEAVFSGFNACVLAYGQSGSGKTYTMMGHNNDSGLVPRICQGLFEKMEQNTDVKLKFRTEISFLEIYNERVSDLLPSHCHSKRPNKNILRVREHPKMGPCVQDLTKHVVTNHSSVLALLEKGIQNRKIAATKMHDHSSRSHAIFTIIFTQARLDTDMPSEIVSKIQLVDLAGSEKAGINTSKMRLKEGANINKSLVALGSVISNLADKSLSHSNTSSPTPRGSSRRGSYAVGGGGGGQGPFVPYRDSVLTWLLKDSLGGNSKTIMIATISPASSAFNETMNTLRYAQRAKCIVNKPIVNEDPKVKLIRELKLEVERLKEMLANAQKAIGDMLVTDIINRNHDKAEELTRNWIEKWNDFRQQEMATTNNCTCIHKNENENDGERINNEDDSIQLLSDVKHKVSEEHVQTVYNAAECETARRCVQCQRSIEEDECVETDIKRLPSESDSSGLSRSQEMEDTADEDGDGWSQTDEFAYVDRSTPKHYLTEENPIKIPRQLSPITELTSDLPPKTFKLSLCNEETEFVTPSNSNWLDFQMPKRIFDYSNSDLDMEQDSLDESPPISPTVKPHDDPKLLLKIEEQFHGVELWTSPTSQQQNSQFASIQPNIMTTLKENWKTVSALNLVQLIPSPPILLNICKSKIDTSPRVGRDSDTSSETSYFECSSHNSDVNAGKFKAKRHPKRSSIFQQRLQAIKRRKRKKTVAKKTPRQNEEEEEEESFSEKSKMKSPPPLPAPFFVPQQQNDELEHLKHLKQESINISELNVNKVDEEQLLTCWQEVVHKNSSRFSEPPVSFDCTSWNNCQSWPSCDSLTMVYVGPKWNSDKENVINSIENTDDSLNTPNQNIIVNCSSRFVTADCCSSKNWSHLNDNFHHHHSDSTLTCAEVSTQTDSGIQIDLPEPACNWSYSTISAASQTKVVGVNNSVQTDVVQCQTSTQTEPITNSTSQQTEPEVSNNSAQSSFQPANISVNKCSKENIESSISSSSSSAINDSGDSSNVSDNNNNNKKSTVLLSTDKLEVSSGENENVCHDKKSTDVNFSHALWCDKGIYIGFHELGQQVRDILVKIKLKDVGEKSEIIAVKNTKLNGTKFDEENEKLVEKCEDEFLEILEPPEEFREIASNKFFAQFLNIPKSEELLKITSIEENCFKNLKIEPNSTVFENQQLTTKEVLRKTANNKDFTCSENLFSQFLNIPKSEELLKITPIEEICSKNTKIEPNSSFFENQHLKTNQELGKFDNNKDFTCSENLNPDIFSQFLNIPNSEELLKFTPIEENYVKNPKIQPNSAVFENQQLTTKEVLRKTANNKDFTCSENLFSQFLNIPKSEELLKITPIEEICVKNPKIEPNSSFFENQHLKTNEELQKTANNKNFTCAENLFSQFLNIPKSEELLKITPIEENCFPNPKIEQIVENQHLTTNSRIHNRQNNKIDIVKFDLNAVKNIVVEDEYYQLPFITPKQTVTSSNSAAKTKESAKKDMKCTCYDSTKWLSASTGLEIRSSYPEDEEISTNLPEDICQLLRECREVRKKAWHEITLAHHQLRFTSTSIKRGVSCAVHGLQ